MSPLSLVAIVPASAAGLPTADDPGLGVVGDDPAAVVTSTAERAVTADALARHHRVVSAIAGAGIPVLPARFGQRVVRADLERWLHANGELLRAALAEVAGCAQMTVRLDGERAQAPAQRPSTGTAYLAGRAALAATPPELETVRAAVAGLFRAERVEAGRTPPTAVTVHHLVARAQVEAYRRSLLSVSVDPYELSVTGPWPVYAFAPATPGT